MLSRSGSGPCAEAEIGSLSLFERELPGEKISGKAVGAVASGGLEGELERGRRVEWRGVRLLDLRKRRAASAALCRNAAIGGSAIAVPGRGALQKAGEVHWGDAKKPVGCGDGEKGSWLDIAAGVPLL